MTDKLHRHIGLGALAIYGIGDILGAGIYGLIGKAAGEMGNAIWIAFLASMMAASFTGLSYASLGSRHHKAGGAAYITQRALKNNFLAYVVGLAALASGLTSMAAGSRAFAGYLSNILNGFSTPIIIIAFGLFIALVVIRGIRESMWMNIICTGVELGGLLFILFVGIKYLGSVNYLDSVTVNNPSGDLSASIILSGAVLTFYSFIGFEDIINVGEEVKNPERNIPRAIMVAVVVSSIIYMGISLVAVSVVPSQDLANSNAPLVDVVKVAAPWFPPVLFTFVALFAVANTALLNFIMGSRLIYGMANQGLMPKILGRVSQRRRTPYISSLLVLVIMLSLALSGDISSLARATSVLLLLCFVAVNSSLIILKSRKTEPKGGFEVPYVVPIIGLLICLAMLSNAKMEELRLAGIIVVVIAGLYLLMRPKGEALEAF